MKNYFQGKKKIIIYALFILLGVFLTISVFFAIQYSKIIKENNIKEELRKENVLKTKKQKLNLKKKEEILSSFLVKAESFYVYDLEKGVEIFSKNKDKKLGIASLTKIATADIVLERLKSSLDMEETSVIILKKNLAKLGDNGLKWGERFEAGKLVEFMMIASSNDAASALTNYLGEVEFIKRMNLLAEELKMNETLFFSESGLDINENILGSYSTAENISKLVKYFYEKYPGFTSKFSRVESKICSEKKCHNVKNTNKLFFEKCTKWKNQKNEKNLPNICIKIEKYPYKILFSKTGYTKKSGGSIAMIAEISGHKILMVVLGSGKESRFSDIRNISETVKKYLKVK